MALQCSTIPFLLCLIYAASHANAKGLLDSGVLSQWPKDSAFRVGQEGRINITIAGGRDVQWIALMAAFVGELKSKSIYTGNPSAAKISSELSQDFEAILEKKHDIRIKSMKWELAGIYVLTISETEAITDDFNIFAVGPTDCSLKNTETTVNEGDFVYLDCSTQYTGPKSRAPTMQWTNEDGLSLPTHLVNHPPKDGETPTTPAPNVPKTITYRTNLTATKDHDAKKFQCNLAFDGEPVISYSDQCDTTFRVRFGATAIVFSPDPTPDRGRFKTGEVLNCSASGNPPPMYKWSGTGPNGPHISEGQVLNMNEGMIGGLNTYTCEARNKINGQDKQASRNITFDVTLDTSNTGTHLTGAIGYATFILFVMTRFF